MNSQKTDKQEENGIEFYSNSAHNSTLPRGTLSPPTPPRAAPAQATLRTPRRDAAGAGQRQLPGQAPPLPRRFPAAPRWGWGRRPPPALRAARRSQSVQPPWETCARARPPQPRRRPGSRLAHAEPRQRGCCGAALARPAGAVPVPL